ncbi:hypothetical protein ACOSQ4_020882 [Xanthoceras sorbifolium]
MNYEDPSEALSCLKQTTTVATYKEAFKRISHRIDHLPEPFLVGYFITGLRDDICLDVKIKQLKSLSEAIGVAHLIEEHNSLNTIFQQTLTSPTTGLLGPDPTQKTGQITAAPFRRIFCHEVRERRERGLCFYCDEKFVPGHRCQRPQLFMIEDSSPNSEPIQTLVDEETILTDPLPKISFHAMAATSHPQTIRLTWKN